MKAGGEKQRRWSSAEGRALLEARGLGRGRELAAEVARGRIVSRARQSAAAVLPGSEPLLVKWRTTLPGHRAKTLARPSHELREARSSLQARRRGIDCPAPLLVAEIRTRGILEGALLVRRFWPDWRDLALTQPDCRNQVDPKVLAAILRDWHERGFRHGDCLPKNLLLSPDRTEGIPIGFPKARFVRPGPKLDRWRVTDLARFTLAIAEFCPPASFLAAYDRAGPSLRALEARVSARARAFHARRQRHARRPPRPAPPAGLPAFPAFHLWKDEARARAPLRV